jgi:hypothetical protein
LLRPDNESWEQVSFRDEVESFWDRELQVVIFARVKDGILFLPHVRAEALDWDARTFS